MDGMPALNFPAFHAAAAQLRAQGHAVENPAEVEANTNANWLECMRLDLPRLLTCEAVYMLPGWERSRGAVIERGLAMSLGLEIVYAPGAGRLAKHEARTCACAPASAGLVSA